MSKILLGNDDKKLVNDVGSVISNVLADKPDFLTRNGTFLLLLLILLLGMLSTQIYYPSYRSCTGILMKDDKSGNYLLYFDGICKNLDSALTDKQINLFKDTAQSIRINAKIHEMKSINNRLVATLHSTNTKLLLKNDTLKVYLTLRTDTQSLLNAFLADLNYNFQNKKK